jgi:hypothetical protein
VSDLSADAALPEITAVERLTLRPGDALVIRLPGQIKVSEQQAQRIIERVRATLRLDLSVPVLVLPGGASVEVIEAPGEITR